MKKFLLLLAVLLGTSLAANAQIGIVGGFTSSKTSLDTEDWVSNLKNVNLYHVGVAYKIESGSIFVLEPALMYEVKGANLYSGTEDKLDIQSVGQSIDTRTGYLQLSAGMQVGLDLLALRPYFVFEPFVGYAITGTENYALTASGTVDNSMSVEKISEAAAEVKNKLEYGFGIGGGVELLNHLQLSVQWFKNLGPLYNDGKIDGSEALKAVSGSYKDIANYTGIKLSLAVFF